MRSWRSSHVGRLRLRRCSGSAARPGCSPSCARRLSSSSPVKRCSSRAPSRRSRTTFHGMCPMPAASARPPIWCPSRRTSTCCSPGMPMLPAAAPRGRSLRGSWWEASTSRSRCFPIATSTRRALSSKGGRLLICRSSTSAPPAGWARGIRQGSSSVNGTPMAMSRCPTWCRRGHRCSRRIDWSLRRWGSVPFGANGRHASRSSAAAHRAISRPGGTGRACPTTSRATTSTPRRRTSRSRTCARTSR